MGYRHKRNATAGKVPEPADFVEGEILVNTTDGRAFINTPAGVKTLLNEDDVAAMIAAAVGNGSGGGGSGSPAIGEGQKWYNRYGQRTFGAIYQNTTGRPIQVIISAKGTGNKFATSIGNPDTGAWLKATGNSDEYPTAVSIIVPDNWYYRCSRVEGTGNPSEYVWLELM